ncbi:hypothetical protein ACOSP7_003286 [Xanthoceras sorbifolium]
MGGGSAPTYCRMQCTEEVQPVEVAEEVVRGKCGASSLIVGEANPELNSMVEKSVLSMVNPGDEISAVNVVIPRMANIDNPGLSEAFVVQDIAINQEDSGEVNSPKRKIWKRLVRGRASSSEDTSMGDPLGKLLNEFSQPLVSEKSPELQQSKLLHWQPPILGFKVSVDAATDLADGSYGVSVVVRDSLGSIVGAVALFFPFLFSVEVAEARALLKGVLFAGHRGFAPFSVGSDAQSVLPTWLSQLAAKDVCVVSSSGGV